MESTKLFCFPFAGGSATTYLKWKNALDPSIKLIPIELAGRGKRYLEPLYKSIEEAIEDIYYVIDKELDGSPYAFFGHSMGSLLAYELLKKISAQKKRMPEIAFLSGKNPPHRRIDKIRHNLPESEFLKELMALGGTPRELLESRELLEMYLPIIRADLKIIETYSYRSESEPLECNLIVMNGKKDIITTCGEMEEWRRYSSKNCWIMHFEGGHFFINDHREKITQLMNNTLANAIYI